VALAFPTFAIAQTCQEIHGLGTSGCAPSPFEGESVEVSGIVYVVPGTFNSGGTYWQCPDGGLTLFDSGLVVSEGDEITVTGDVGAFGDEIQINSPVVTVNSHGNETFARLMTTGGLAAGNDEFGSLALLQGLLTKISGGFNSSYEINDGTGAVLVFVDGTTGIDTDRIDLLVGDIVVISGATKCFDGMGELLPRRDEDISLLAIPVEDESWGTLKSSFK